MVCVNTQHSNHAVSQTAFYKGEHQYTRTLAVQVAAEELLRTSQNLGVKQYSLLLCQCKEHMLCVHIWCATLLTWLLVVLASEPAESRTSNMSGRCRAMQQCNGVRSCKSNPDKVLQALLGKLEEQKLGIVFHILKAASTHWAWFMSCSYKVACKSCTEGQTSWLCHWLVKLLMQQTSSSSMNMLAPKLMSRCTSSRWLCITV